MLHEKICFILNELGAQNKDIAKYSLLDASAICRLKSGKRVPKQSSPTIKKFSKSVYLYAKENNLEDLLKGIILSDAQTEEKTVSDLTQWLFEEENITKQNASDAFSFFGDKLSSVMTLAELSNVKLGKMINTDPSYISRFRNGKRTPKSNPELIDTLTQALLEQIAAHNRIDELLLLINSSNDITENRELIFTRFKNWLCDFESYNEKAVKSLLEAINVIPMPAQIKLPPLEAIIEHNADENKSIYEKESGFKEAVIRFLKTVIKSDAKEILLYSDQNTDWMTDDNAFNEKWKALMLTLVQKGVKIKIIHNIDRDIREMTDAIKNWLPLYMSGCIEPYYLSSKNGNRFSHTIFLCPNIACIEAFHLNATEADGLYNYYTDDAHLDFYERSFEKMLSLSKLLVFMRADNQINEKGTTAKEFSNIEIILNKASVVVVRNSPPKISFVILHPLLCEALRKFIMNNEDKSI